MFHVPTANLSVTAGLAIIAFFTTHIIGIREKGFGKYLLSVLGSMTIPLFFLAIIEQFVRPFSLALRLYGNLYGEEMVTENLYKIFPVGVPLVMQILSILFCLIQVLVFTMLLSIYVKEAAEDPTGLSRARQGKSLPLIEVLRALTVGGKTSIRYKARRSNLKASGNLPVRAAAES